MLEFIALRKSQWFVDIQPGTPGSIVTARYMGTFGTSTDPLAGGRLGPKPDTVYQVMLLSTSDKLLAPCPDFCNGSEQPTLNEVDIAIIKAASEIARVNR